MFFNIVIDTVLITFPKFYFDAMHIMFDTPVAAGREVQWRHTGASGGPWCLSSDPCNVFPGVLEWAYHPAGM